MLIAVERAEVAARVGPELDAVQEVVGELQGVAEQVGGPLCEEVAGAEPADGMAFFAFSDGLIT